MSAPHSNHSDKNYPEDGVSHYPSKKRRKNNKGPATNIANRLTAKAQALQKMLDDYNGKK